MSDHHAMDAAWSRRPDEAPTISYRNLEAKSFLRRPTCPAPMPARPQFLQGENHPSDCALAEREAEREPGSTPASAPPPPWWCATTKPAALARHTLTSEHSTSCPSPSLIPLSGSLALSSSAQGGSRIIPANPLSSMCVCTADYSAPADASPPSLTRDSNCTDSTTLVPELSSAAVPKTRWRMEGSAMWSAQTLACDVFVQRCFVMA